MYSERQFPIITSDRACLAAWNNYLFVIGGDDGTNTKAVDTTQKRLNSCNRNIPMHRLMAQPNFQRNDWQCTAVKFRGIFG